MSQEDQFDRKLEVMKKWKNDVGVNSKSVEWQNVCLQKQTK